ncbi:tripartite tricarboxylate transporter substrate binding protein [Caenimonas sedimenti]|uniref:Tripartite tricarboxylate transporter substrate binding protein n=1 Tax=Caenimonas sedimenti TaxID=2596921 RepID=A0A562ZMQ0_9BURK|nr:tripartite tricarboxylate transporter substrate binding protein [Caenimonas sedimenti]TWO69444.1 tripartite tricarboxylate transporter substrate binding protein [Caenimonas sedimenti]
MKKRHFLRIAAAVPLASASHLAWAQATDYPNRPVRIISPFAAGSTSDTSARFIAQQLTQALGQPVTVENQPGADGRIGMMAVKNAPADGYTIVAGSWTNLAVNTIVSKDLPYDPLKDFKPVAGIGRSMLGIAVSGQSDIKTFQDLIAAAKRKPKGTNFGNFAAGYRLATEWLSGLAGVQFTHVPYRSTSQMNTDLAAKQIDVGMDGVTSMTALVKQGQLRLLAVTGDQRHSEFPDVPTIKEFYPEFSIYGWSALMVRSEVPDAITNKLADAMTKILQSSEGRDFAKKVGSELLLRSTGEMRKYQVAQIETLRRVADAAGIKAE